MVNDDLFPTLRVVSPVEYELEDGEDETEGGEQA